LRSDSGWSFWDNFTRDSVLVNGVLDYQQDYSYWLFFGNFYRDGLALREGETHDLLIELFPE